MRRTDARSGQQEPAGRHAAEGVWYGAHVDRSFCGLQRTEAGYETAIGLFGCLTEPTLFVLDVRVEDGDAVGTLTVGPAPPMGSGPSMRRLLQGQGLASPAAREIRGTAESGTLTVATTDSASVVIEATVRSGSMQARMRPAVENGEQSIRVRLERCDPDSRSSEGPDVCTIDGAWRHLARENAGVSLIVPKRGGATPESPRQKAFPIPSPPFPSSR